LETIQVKLGAMAESFAASAPLAGAKLGGFVHQLSHKYTMASERHVYAKVMGGEAHPSPEPESVSVELFHLSRPTPEAAPEPIPAPPSGSKAGTAPLSPAEQVSNISASIAGAPPANEMGNNVELF
jgi:hypothetical protein